MWWENHPNSGDFRHEVIADTMFTWARELGAIDFAHWTLSELEGWNIRELWPCLEIWSCFFDFVSMCIYIHTCMKYVYILYIYNDITIHVAMGGYFLLSRRRHPTWLWLKKNIKKSFKSLKRAGEWYCLWWLGKTEHPCLCHGKIHESVGFIGSLDLYLGDTKLRPKTMSFRIKIWESHRIFRILHNHQPNKPL